MILVLNMGLKSIRAIVFDADGQKHRSAARPIQTTLRGGGVEQDPNDWWRLGSEVMMDVLTDGDVRKAITAITVTTSSCCLVCVDADGNPLRNSLMVSDQRAAGQANQLDESEAFQAAKAANPNLLASPSMMIPKIMWVREEEPDVFSATRWFLSPNDFLMMKLGGVVCTDPLNAEKLFYSAADGAYLESILSLAGVTADQLPKVEPQGATIADLSPAVAKKFGLGSGIKLVQTTYDAICAFYGTGASEPGDACDVSGTVTSLRTLTDGSSSLKEDGGVFVQRDAQTGCTIIGGSNNLGGGLIEWTKQCLFRGEERPYEAMEAEAAEIAAGSEGLIFLPYLLGERAPLWDLEARGVFFGIERTHGRAQMVRAVFESAAYSVRLLQKAIEDRGAEVKRLYVSGGLARIGLISKIKADVMGTEIQVPAEFETTALGAFILVLIGLGEVDSLTDAKAFVPIREVIVPNARLEKRYTAIHSFYTMLYKNCVPLFKERKELLASFRDEQSVAIHNL